MIRLTEQQLHRLRTLQAYECAQRPDDAPLIAARLVEVVDDATVDITARGRGLLALYSATPTPLGLRKGSA